MNAHPFEPGGNGRYCRVAGCGQTPQAEVHQTRLTRTRVVVVIDHDLEMLPDDVRSRLLYLLEEVEDLTLVDIAALP